MNSKNLVKTYFPEKENKIVTDLLERVHQCMINTINSKSSIGMLKTIKGVSQNVVNAGVKVLDSFIESEVCDDFSSSLKISEEDENMSSDVLNILINEIVSPVIEQSKEIGTSS